MTLGKVKFLHRFAIPDNLLLFERDGSSKWQRKITGVDPDFIQWCKDTLEDWEVVYCFERYYIKIETTNDFDFTMLKLKLGIDTPTK